jgi:hypothetical protein
MYCFNVGLKARSKNGFHDVEDEETKRRCKIGDANIFQSLWEQIDCEKRAEEEPKPVALW